MAHNLFHLLAEGKSIFNTGMAALGISVSSSSAAVVSMGTIHILQYVLLLLGMLGSMYTAYKISKSHYTAADILRITLPIGILIVVLTMANAYLFTLPMVHRMCSRPR